MSPANSVHNFGNMLSIESKIVSDLLFGVSSCGPSSSDFANGFLCQLSLTVGFAVSAQLIPKNIDRVTHVLAWGNVLKIGKAVVSPCAIDVIDLIPFRARANKSVHDYTVNLTGVGLPVNREADLGVSFGIWSAGKRAVAIGTPDTAEIRDHVDTFVSRYISPLFGFKFIWGKIVISHCATSIAYWLGNAGCTNILRSCFYLPTLYQKGGVCL